MTTTRTIASASTRAWVDLLRAHCLSLCDSTAISAVSTSRAFAHGEEPVRDSIIQLAKRMAEEYGLTSEAEVRGHYLTLRFTRAQPVVAELEAEKPLSLGEKVRSLLRFKRQPALRTQPENAAEEATFEDSARRR